MPPDSAIQMTFLGGASAVGASCTLVETEAANVLVDCGIRFEAGHSLPDLSPLSGKRLDAIVLTHAHTDHTGALPVVCEAFPSTPVYATPPTIDLVGILFRDALRLMNSSDRETEVPLFNELQVAQALAALVPVSFGASVTVFGVEIAFLPASHILGAAMISLSTPAGRVLFTGDYSVSSQATVPALLRPSTVVDVVVSEATYGERLHEDRRAAERRFLEQVRQVVEAGGRVLVPAFAIGRAQEVLRILRGAFARHDLPSVPVFVDGMVRAVCDVYRRHERYVSGRLASEIRHGTHPFYTSDIRPVESAAERARALTQSPSVIVASSGMLSGGASVLYAQSLAGQARDAILVTGYQDEESPGRALLRLSSGQGERTLKLGNTTVEVACSVSSYGLSAHADRMQMAGLLEALKPRTIVLVHGDTGARDSLASALSCRDVVLPQDGQTVVRRGRSSAGSRPRTKSDLPTSEDVDRIRALLGPARKESVRDRVVAEAWFGEDLTGEQVDRLVNRLEDLGLVRRDDNRRGSLWILAPDETNAFPAEALAQQRLKNENPKGKLLELCNRLRCPAPKTAVQVEGAWHVAETVLELNNSELRSGPQRASVRKTAEQLAAARLLELLEQALEVPEAIVVDEDRAAALKDANAKGRLLEQVAKSRCAPPTFEHRAVLKGYAVRVVLDASKSPIATRWYTASNARAAEQAAAEEALRQLSSTPQSSIATEESETSAPVIAPAVPAKREVRGLLNEMRQHGLLLDYGFEVSDPEGPGHQPAYRIRGWVQLEDESFLEAESSASSKKAAERAAGEVLWDLLAQKGLVGKR